MDHMRTGSLGFLDNEFISISAPILPGMEHFSASELSSGSDSHMAYKSFGFIMCNKGPCLDFYFKYYLEVSARYHLKASAGLKATPAYI